LFEAAHLENRAIRQREIPYLPPHQIMQFSIEIILFWCRPRISQFPRLLLAKWFLCLIQGYPLHAARFSSGRPGGIDPDCDQPRGKARLLPELPNVHKGVQHRFLDHVVGLIRAV
jgi:hypothetical protein